jgi:hypothetical protein
MSNGRRVVLGLVLKIVVADKRHKIAVVCHDNIFPLCRRLKAVVIAVNGVAVFLDSFYSLRYFRRHSRGAVRVAIRWFAVALHQNGNLAFFDSGDKFVVTRASRSGWANSASENAQRSRVRQVAVSF